LIFLNIHKKSGENMIKTRSNFNLCGEDIISKFNYLIASYNFTIILNQMTFSFLTTYNP
jgi:hypothetical protein